MQKSCGSHRRDPCLFQLLAPPLHFCQRMYKLDSQCSAGRSRCIGRRASLQQQLLKTSAAPATGTTGMQGFHQVREYLTPSISGTDRKHTVPPLCDTIPCRIQLRLLGLSNAAPFHSSRKFVPHHCFIVRAGSQVESGDVLRHRSRHINLPKKARLIRSIILRLREDDKHVL